MKIISSTIILGILCTTLVFSAYALEYNLASLPLRIPEEGKYAEENWRIDRLAGNTGAGSRFYQGPALEVGGLIAGWVQTGRAVVGVDGTIYLTKQIPGQPYHTLLKLTTDGQLRVLMEPEGLWEGPIENCKSGNPIWNPYENTLYLSGPYCLRKVVKHGDGSYWVEKVAGICNTSGEDDGPALSATLKEDYGVVCNDSGVCYWLEHDALRKIENGKVSTINLSRPETPGYLFNIRGFWDVLSIGENENTLYISDYYGLHGKAVLKLDVSTGVLTRVIGIDPGTEDPYKRNGQEADGPARTHASFVGGIRAKYDPYHNAVLLSGSDNNHIRWNRLTEDGWVRTIIGDRTRSFPDNNQLNSLGLPAEEFSIRALMAHCVDSRGRLIISGILDHTGYWRAYNINDVGGDVDGDNVPDVLDLFPNDASEWADNDGDGIGDNADTDDDNDGMSDSWEITYGLDPLTDDAALDADGDGVPNIDEFTANSDPTDAPVNVDVIIALPAPQNLRILTDDNVQNNTDFADLCSAPGVLVCEGFDSQAALDWKAEGAAGKGFKWYGVDPAPGQGTLDKTIKASGEGSLRFNTPDPRAPEGAGTAGFFRQPFGTDFGEGSTFYVRWRMRFSPEMLNLTYENTGGSSGFKQIIVHSNKSTCAATELTFTNPYFNGYPIWYTACGARKVENVLDGAKYQRQQGDYATCVYPNQLGSNDCWYFTFNEWLTFYWKVQIGNWGQSNSHLEAWVARESGPFEKIFDKSDMRLDSSGDYNYVTLLPYMNNRASTGTPTHPQAYVWYDELIVSENPIAPLGY